MRRHDCTPVVPCGSGESAITRRDPCGSTHCGNCVNVKPRVKCYWLNFHLPYACRHSGLCCTSGWPIPVEHARVAAIEEHIARDVIPLQIPHGVRAGNAAPWLVTAANMPEDVAGTLALRDNAHCAFFGAGRPGCAIHGIKPASCTHFPLVCLFDQRGVHVTLSHYCPTSTALLFEHSGPIAICEGPSPLPDVNLLEGLRAATSPRSSAPEPRCRRHCHGPKRRAISTRSGWRWSPRRGRTSKMCCRDMQLQRCSRRGRCISAQVWRPRPTPRESPPRSCGSNAHGNAARPAARSIARCCPM